MYRADSHAASSFTSTHTEGREKTESEEEGQQQKDREGAERETTEMKKRTHNRERKLGPKASKVAKGEK